MSYRDDRHAVPGKRQKKNEEEEEDLNDANYDEVHHRVTLVFFQN